MESEVYDVNSDVKVSMDYNVNSKIDWNSKLPCYLFNSETCTNSVQMWLYIYICYILKHVTFIHS